MMPKPGPYGRGACGVGELVRPQQFRRAFAEKQDHSRVLRRVGQIDIIGYNVAVESGEEAVGGSRKAEEPELLLADLEDEPLPLQTSPMVEPETRNGGTRSRPKVVAELALEKRRGILTGHFDPCGRGKGGEAGS